MKWKCASKKCKQAKKTKRWNRNENKIQNCRRWTKRMFVLHIQYSRRVFFSSLDSRRCEWQSIVYSRSDYFPDTHISGHKKHIYLPNEIVSYFFEKNKKNYFNRIACFLLSQCERTTIDRIFIIESNCEKRDRRLTHQPAKCKHKQQQQIKMNHTAYIMEMNKL